MKQRKPLGLRDRALSYAMNEPYLYGQTIEFHRSQLMRAYMAGANAERRRAKAATKKERAK